MAIEKFLAGAVDEPGFSVTSPAKLTLSVPEHVATELDLSRLKARKPWKKLGAQAIRERAPAGNRGAADAIANSQNKMGLLNVRRDAYPETEALYLKSAATFAKLYGDVFSRIKQRRQSPSSNAPWQCKR